MPSAVPLVRVVRSGLEESVHLGHVAVCDADGRLLAAVGDPLRLVFARSSMKPLQAALSIRLMPATLADDLIAVACGSHNAEPDHVLAVRRLLRAGGAVESMLRCPEALPSRTEDAIRAGKARRIFYNCSGKHAAMLAACLGAGWPTETYLEPGHPLQREILQAVRWATGVQGPAIGVDGCGVPVHGVPLSAMATLFARLTRPERLGGLEPTASRAVAAMRAHPFLVAGTGRTDTELMASVPGIVSKVGAEALHCAAVLGEGIGVAVKIADGGDRAAGSALVHALSQIGAIGEEELGRLSSVARPAVLGGGRRVGGMVAEFRLRRPRA
ncbi:MAG: asparaginase [Actinomycetota bacterium]